MAFTCFLSDCHLSIDRPPLIQCFIDFVNVRAQKADALYILGDLYDCWLGDGIEIDEPLRDVQRSLLRLGRYKPVYFIHGNHDFLVSRRYARKNSLILLKQLSVINLYNKNTLITHGDLLCSDDRRYQRYRRFIQNPMVKLILNQLPASVKQNLAKRIIKINNQNKASNQAEIMDVNQETVLKLMRRHGVTRLIHGHTHKPAIHAMDVDGQKGQRIVLGDWYRRGSVLFVDDKNRAELETLEA